jgi:Flp pilus assembly protein TadB
MKETKFDKQLADLVWVITTLLRGGHSLRQIFEVLAIESPEPTASSCNQVNDDLRRGVSFDQAMSNWLQTTSSNHLADVVATIQRQQQTGGNLAFMLESVGEKILARVGSDGAFYSVMQNVARQEAAPLPSRIIDTD